MVPQTGDSWAALSPPTGLQSEKTVLTPLFHSKHHFADAHAHYILNHHLPPISWRAQGGWVIRFVDGFSTLFSVASFSRFGPTHQSAIVHVRATLRLSKLYHYHSPPSLEPPWSVTSSQQNSCGSRGHHFPPQVFCCIVILSLAIMYASICILFSDDFSSQVDPLPKY